MEINSKIISEFKIYNRYQELERREREKKELAWEEELELAMKSSDPLGAGNTRENLHTCRSCPKLDISKLDQTTHKLKKLKSCDSCIRSKTSRPIEKLSESFHSQLHQLSEKFSDGKEKSSEAEGKVVSQSKDSQNKLYSLDYIDRTPSPIDKKSGST